jgi:hypothetical protein
MSRQGYVMRPLPRILPNKNKRGKKKLLGVEIRHFYTAEVMCRTVCWADIESDKNKLRSGTGMTSEKTKTRRPRRE